MPEICNFNGISIKLIWADHLPKHLHIFVGSGRTKITFDGEILSGKLEPDKINGMNLGASPEPYSAAERRGI